MKPSVHAALAHIVPEVSAHNCAYPYKTDAHEALVALYRRDRLSCTVQETGGVAGSWRRCLLVTRITSYKHAVTRDMLNRTAEREKRRELRLSPHYRRALSAARAALKVHSECLSGNRFEAVEGPLSGSGNEAYREVEARMKVLGSCKVGSWDMKKVLNQHWTFTAETGVEFHPAAAAHRFVPAHYSKMVADVANAHAAADDNTPDDVNGEVPLDMSNANGDNDFASEDVV